MSTNELLVMSIQPQWVDQIVAGLKTVELRRRPPSLSRPTRAIIYETSPRKRVRVICEMGPVTSGPVGEVWKNLGKQSRVSEDHYSRYFDGMSQAHAIHIGKVMEFPNLLPLDVLRSSANFIPPQSWYWAKPALIKFIEKKI